LEGVQPKLKWRSGRGRSAGEFAARHRQGFHSFVAFALLAWACGPARPGSPPYSVTVDLTESIRDLGSDDLEVSEPAAERIESLGAAALPVLDQALQRESPAIRARAVEAVGVIGEPQGVPLLTRAAADPDPAVRENAILALGAIGDERGGDAIEAALGDREGDVRHAAARACGSLCRSPQAFAQLAEMALREQPIGKTLAPRQSLRTALEGESSEVARAAARQRVDAALSQADDADLRGRAALLLVDLRDPRAPGALAEAAASQIDLSTRVQVVLTLGSAGDETAVPALRQALEDGKAVPRPIVCRAVGDLARRNVRGAASLEPACATMPAAD
jgi:HEAT repeat protein